PGRLLRRDRRRSVQLAAGRRGDHHSAVEGGADAAVSAGYLLRLIRDRLEPGGRLSLPPTNRVLYVVYAQLSIEGATLTANEARPGVVRERPRARLRARGVGSGHQLPPLRDPAARDPRPELDHVRRSRPRRQQAAALHRVRRRADRAAVAAA